MTYQDTFYGYDYSSDNTTNTPEQSIKLRDKVKAIRRWIQIKRALKKVGNFETEMSQLDQIKADLLSENITLDEFKYAVYEKFFDFKLFLNQKVEDNDWDFFVDFVD